MKKRLFSTLFIAVSTGALVAAPAMGSALAAAPIPVHQQPPGSDWGGFGRPGWSDPHDPWHSDWHCDRHGRWHTNEHDQWGHQDGRCHVW